MRIHYQLLQQQRNGLLAMQAEGRSDEEQKLLDGIVNLMDALLDEGLELGLCFLDDEGNIKDAF